MKSNAEVQASTFSLVSYNISSPKFLSFLPSLNFSELINEINYQVSKEVLKIGKTQTPVVLPGLEIGEKWKTLKW